VVDGVVDMVGRAGPAGGPAQRLMETRFYSQGYEKLFRPALTRLVTAQSLRSSVKLSLAMLGPRPDDWILDVGSGTGNFTRAIAEHLTGGGFAVAADLSAAMLVHGAQVARRTPSLPLLFVRANALMLPFAADSFDRVHTSAAIQLFDDPTRAVTELVRVLRPGGTLVIATFVRSSSWSSRQSQEWLGGRIGFRWFAPARLHEILGSAGMVLREEVIEGAAITLSAIKPKLD
jgi:SAM-dependent methyltransferase